VNEVEKLLESLRKIELTALLSDPKKLLGLIEQVSPTDCDTTPLFYTLQLSAGETLNYTVGAPMSFVGINTKMYVDVSVAYVLDGIISLDGKPKAEISRAKATAGGFDIELYGWMPATNILYHLYNNHSDNIEVFIVSYGAWLHRKVWGKIEAKLKEFGIQLIQEGAIG
jgi:hypothetical protein